MTDNTDVRMSVATMSAESPMSIQTSSSNSRTSNSSRKRKMEESTPPSMTEDEAEELALSQFKDAQLKDRKLRRCGQLLLALEKCKSCVKDAISDVSSVRGFSSAKIYLEDVVELANKAAHMIDQLEANDPLFKQ